MNLEQVISKIDFHSMNSEYENHIAKYFTTLHETQDAIKLLLTFLTHEDYKVRMLGLRLVRRRVRNNKILLEVIKKSFMIERLNELGKWYFAILSQYPTSSFIKKLESEILGRRDDSFMLRHLRALQLRLAHGGRKEKEKYKEFKLFLNEHSELIAR
ncbi:MAG: hypothetical protein VSS75_008185 [Candidatus Parabeggiatoa sp.]|nr:hypothetical protein [Candidatus Parabeggiatoa sp.]